ncbi:MAG: hypothetical protein R2710_19850 [Acidimicrobiales bacterium]
MFGPGDFAPVDATCAGANQPPTLEWSDAGPDTAEWAVSLSDQTDPANLLLLWLVVGIDPATTSLDPDRAPAPIETLNDYGQLGYGNLHRHLVHRCPRDLQFRVYSLTAPTGIASGAAGNESWDCRRRRQRLRHVADEGRRQHLSGQQSPRWCHPAGSRHMSEPTTGATPAFDPHRWIHQRSTLMLSPSRTPPPSCSSPTGRVSTVPPRSMS